MKRAALITDISGLGNCSGNANISILSAMGVESCLIPTAVLSAQTGFSQSAVISMAEPMKKIIDSLIEISPKLDVIYVGFMANACECEYARELISFYRQRGTTVIVDPISGDNGKRFGFLDDRAFDKLAQLAFDADIITPNLTELCLLSGGNYEDIINIPENELFGAIISLCGAIGRDRGKITIVTGIDCGEEIANITVKDGKYTAARAKRSGGSMSGTGDIFTSVICAAAANKQDISAAAQKAASFISHVMINEADNITDRNYGIPYQKYIYMLINKK